MASSIQLRVSEPICQLFASLLSLADQPGELFTIANVTTKRPGTGISPMHWDALIGRKATRDYAPDELIEW